MNDARLPVHDIDKNAALQAARFENLATGLTVFTGRF